MVGDFSPNEPDEQVDDLSALDFYQPVVPEAESDLAALDALVMVHGADDDAVEPEPVFAVTNPPGTVTVTAHPDGRIRRIELSPRAVHMSERELAEEVVVIAELATQDARAGQYVAMLDGMRKQGHDDPATRDFLQRDLDLPTPEETRARRAEVFATRYGGSHE